MQKKYWQTIYLFKTISEPSRKPFANLLLVSTLSINQATFSTRYEYLVQLQCTIIARETWYPPGLHPCWPCDPASPQVRVVKQRPDTQ